MTKSTHSTKAAPRSTSPAQDQTSLVAEHFSLLHFLSTDCTDHSYNPCNLRCSQLSMATNSKNRLWTRDELIIAFNLYCKIPFGKIDQSNPVVIALANELGRTPASLAWKLANFARLDPTLQARGISGASHGSKGEIEVWEEFNNNWDSLAFESERLLANLTHRSVEEMNGLNEDELPKEGLEREQIVKVRVNQRFFRSAVLTSY